MVDHWIILQQGASIFRDSSSFTIQLASTISWAVVTPVVLQLLLGFRMRWVSEREQAKLHDEWNRYVSGEECRKGIAALGVDGIALMLTRLWLPIGEGPAIFLLVNGATLIAVFRCGWLNGSGPEDDE